MLHSVRNLELTIHSKSCVLGIERIAEENKMGNLIFTFHLMAFWAHKDILHEKNQNSAKNIRIDHRLFVFVCILVHFRKSSLFLAIAMRSKEIVLGIVLERSVNITLINGWLHRLQHQTSL